jgi:hypothetical protein
VRTRSLGPVIHPRSEDGDGRLLILAAGSRSKYYTTPGALAVKHDIEAYLGALGTAALLTGGANGADQWAREWGFGHLAARYNLLMRADWTRYGKQAGRVRNSAMAERVKAAGGRGWKVQVHIWWDMRSSGSEHMRDVAQRRGLDVVVHDMSRYRR